MLIQAVMRAKSTNHQFGDTACTDRRHKRRGKEFTMDLPGSLNERTVSTVQIKISLLLVLGLLHVLVTLFFIVPGYLLIDEAIYHWASKYFAQTGGFEVWNGYTEFPSPELHHMFAAPYKGRLVAQYPYLFTVLSYPFYRVLGFYGLFLCNAMAFIGVVALCYVTARKLFADIDLALNACLILVLCTFAWEYSQAAWPHMTSVLCTMGAFYLFVCSYYSNDKLKSLILALGSGLIAGFGPSVRMEGALLFPVLVLPFLFDRPWRPREALAVMAGILPGLTIFAMANHVKFGMLSPFTYGGPTNFSPYVGIALAGTLVAIWIPTRSRFTGIVSRHRRKLYAAVFVALVALAFVPQVRDVCLRVLTYSYVSLVDIRSLDADLVRPAMRRSAGGGVVYIGAQKKALLQSLPYLVLLLIPMIRIAQRDEDSWNLVVLFLLPAITVGYYAYAFHSSRAYEGGLCLNYRYYVPLLPFLSILSAYAMREMRTRWGEPLGFRTASVLCFLTVGAYLLLVYRWPRHLDYLEFPLLVLPLFAAGFLLTLLLVGEVVSGREIRMMRSVVWTACVCTLTWASMVSFFYDYPLHRNQRVVNFSIGGAMRRVVAPNSIFFTFPVIDPFMRLVESDRVRIAFPNKDRFKDFPELVKFHINAGRRVYGAFYDELWKELMSGPLSGYTVTRRFRPIPAVPRFWVGEISEPKESEPTGSR